MSNRSFLVITVLLDCLTQAEVSVNTFRVDFDCVFEVLGCPLSLPHISKEIGEVNAPAKVVIVYRQTLFETKNSLLHVPLLLVANSKVVKAISLWWRILIVCCL
jgi:hypothetical protein